MFQELKLSFSQKIKLLIKILEITPSLSNRYSNLEERLKKMRDFRNDLAHAQMDLSQQKIDKLNPRIKYNHNVKGKIRSYVLTEKQFKEKRKLANELIQDLAKIKKNFNLK